nr:reverse transcriptase domain-containing protein [Tanacetum cinerariifolium]
MPFGLCNAPGTFQRCMMIMFHDMIEKTMEVFMDDFSVFGNSFQSCLSHLERMLKRCEDTNLCLNWEKSHFMVKEGIVLGHKISKQGIEVDKEKVDVISKLPHPTTVKEQRQDKHFRPIHYANKTMTEAESNYTTIEKEMLAVVYAFEKFRSYLILFKSIVYTDHSALKYLFQKKESKEAVKSSRLATLDQQEVTMDQITQPERAIISDRGTHFCNDQFTKVMQKYGVTHRLATSYHPQTSGQVEVSNRGLQRILERAVGENRASWSDKLDDALWAFRTAYKTPIGCTPYKPFYEKACHLPVELEHKAYWALKHVNFDLKTAGDHRKVQINELNELHDQADENSLIYKEKTKRIHDSKIKNRVFNIGDRVKDNKEKDKIRAKPDKIKHKMERVVAANTVVMIGDLSLVVLFGTVVLRLLDLVKSGLIVTGPQMAPLIVQIWAQSGFKGIEEFLRRLPGLRVADSHTSNHSKDDFTPLKTIRRSYSVIKERIPFELEEETFEPERKEEGIILFFSTSPTGSSWRNCNPLRDLCASPLSLHTPLEFDPIRVFRRKTELRPTSGIHRYSTSRTTASNVRKLGVLRNLGFGCGNRFGNGGNKFGRGHGNGNKGVGSSRQPRRCYNCGDKIHLISDCPKPKEHKTFISGAWSDIEDDDQRKKDTTFLMVFELQKYNRKGAGDSYKVPANADPADSRTGRTITPTTEDMQKKKNDVKARTTLLLSLPDEHQLRFSKYKTARELWAVILKTFGGNEATKKRKKNLLKQQYGNFKAEGTETLEQTFNRLQVIVSQLQFMDVDIEKDDLNQKFLTSLAPEWLIHTIVRRNMNDLHSMSLDDLYNHLKVYEAEVQKKPNSNPQDMAFISSSKNSNNEDGNTVCVTTATTPFPTGSVNVATTSQDIASAFIASQSNGSQIKFEDINQIDEDDMEEMDIKWNMALLSMRADKFWKRTGKKISIQGSDVAGFDKSKVECFNYHKMGHFAREYRAPRNQERVRKESYRQGSKAEEKSSKALMAIDGVGWDWSYMANEEDHALVADGETPTEFALMANNENKLARLLKSSKDLEDIIESQKSEKVKEGLGYNDVPPPPADLYLSPKKDLSWLAYQNLWMTL